MTLFSVSLLETQGILQEINLLILYSLLNVFKENGVNKHVFVHIFKYIICRFSENHIPVYKRTGREYHNGYETMVFPWKGFV